MLRLSGLLWEQDMWSEHINRISETTEQFPELFSEKVEFVYWPPGWHHIVVDMLRRLREEKLPIEILRIKHHYGQLKIHYRCLDQCEKIGKIIKITTEVTMLSCIYCGSFLRDGFRCPTHG